MRKSKCESERKNRIVNNKTLDRVENSTRTHTEQIVFVADCFNAYTGELLGSEFKHYQSKKSVRIRVDRWAFGVVSFGSWDNYLKKEQQINERIVDFVDSLAEGTEDDDSYEAFTQSLRR